MVVVLSRNTRVTAIARKMKPNTANSIDCTENEDDLIDSDDVPEMDDRTKMDR